jgi:holo-[acyl-carrier protein] synthase
MTVLDSTDFRVGLDMASVAQVAEAIETHGDRYLQRIFTPHELECCQTEHGALSAESLTARWAAKEATLKVLRPNGEQPEWRSIEVRRLEGGACTLELTGKAATMAAEAGITGISLSLTHEGPYAAAIVLAVCGNRPTANGEMNA